MKTSYPFLWFSKINNLDYGTVLNAAQYLKDNRGNETSYSDCIILYGLTLSQVIQITMINSQMLQLQHGTRAFEKLFHVIDRPMPVELQVEQQLALL